MVSRAKSVIAENRAKIESEAQSFVQESDAKMRIQIESLQSRLSKAEGDLMQANQNVQSALQSMQKEKLEQTSGKGRLKELKLK